MFFYEEETSGTPLKVLESGASRRTDIFISLFSLYFYIRKKRINIHI